MRLLLVEDNAELARLLTAGLAAQGFSADVVETAADARLALSSIRYSALILDLGLPDEDGMTILKELRRGRDPPPFLVLPSRGGVAARVHGHGARQRRRPGPGPARRRRRLSGQALCARGTGRPAAGADAKAWRTAGPLAL